MSTRATTATMSVTIDPEERALTVYQQLRSLLADGKWHTERELEELVTFPEEWIDELRRDTDTVVEEIDGERVVRLVTPRS